MSFREKQLSCTRRSSRFGSPEGVWVYWECAGLDDVSRIRDVSTSGVFVQTDKARRQGETAKIEFLVEEGHIRTEAVVQRLEESTGLGLKFVAINDDDRPRLAALLTRLRGCRAEERKRIPRDAEFQQDA